MRDVFFSPFLFPFFLEIFGDIEKVPDTHRRLAGLVGMYNGGLIWWGSISDGEEGGRMDACEIWRAV